MKDNTHIKFDDQRFITAISELTTIRNSLAADKEDIIKIINSVGNDWTSEASSQLCTNMKNSLNSFQSYITELSRVLTYMNTTINDWNKMNKESSSTKL